MGSLSPYLLTLQNLSTVYVITDPGLAVLGAIAKVVNTGFTHDSIA